MKSELCLNINKLVYGYSDKELITIPFSAEIKSPSLIMVMGSNGTGKSTLLRILGGIDHPTSGEVLLNQKTINTSQTAFVFSHRPSVEFMKVKDLVRSGLNFRNTSEQRVMNVLERMKIRELANKHIDQLSDGEFQKTMISRCLLKQASVIFMDEPTAFLDYQSKRNLMEILKEVCMEEHKIIFVSTHDPEWAAEFADFVWLLKNQEIKVLQKTEIEIGSLRQRLVGG